MFGYFRTERFGLDGSIAVPERGEENFTRTLNTTPYGKNGFSNECWNSLMLPSVPGCGTTAGYKESVAIDAAWLRYWNESQKGNGK